MNKTVKRSLALVMVLVLCLSFLPAFSIDTSAASVDYVYSGKYIYNWGERGEPATFLSPNAEKFYTGSRSYEALSSYSGATNVGDVPNSQLYLQLQAVMKNAQTYQTSYDITRSLYMYTDCENSGGSISSFYSGKAIGPDWDSGSSWNREHTWPNSKGLGGNDETDIMMLRPTSTSENSLRGNDAYGKSSGYYNPNSESGGKYDLRGDVARIFLYVYVRWGNKSYAWGSSGVMESKAVLLEWMEADPVDTWELGRNDSVESITGTRNVFVDYPELGFLLFGEEVPEGYTTPGGASDTKCEHNNYDAGVVTAPTCTEKGYTLYTCKTTGCGSSYKANFVDPKGHSFVGGSCTTCGEKEAQAPAYVKEFQTGVPYKLGIFSTAKGSEYYFNGTMKDYYGATDTAYENGVDLYVEEASGGYKLYFKNGSTKNYIYLVTSGTHFNFTYSTTNSSVFTWDSSKYSFKTTVSGETCYIGTYGQYFTMGVIRSSKMTDSDYFARLYTSSGGSQGGGSDTTCQHSYNSVVTKPTCTKDGYTTHTCTKCGDSYTDATTPKTGHSYVDGTCTVCGAVQSTTAGEYTLSFADTSSRTEFSTSKQVWVSGGVTLTNNKNSSNVDVANYSNPARFYQGSELIIACEGMTKIVIDCTGLDSKYVTSWLNVPSGATATNNNNIITIEFVSPTDTLTYASLAKQSRAYSIKVYVEVEEEIPTPCQHPETRVEGASEATCTSDGHTGKTVCVDCGEVIDEGSVITSRGHSFDEWSETKVATCTAPGKERRDCTKCSHYETRDTEPRGHSDGDGDGVCNRCGETVSENPDNPDTPDNNEGNTDGDKKKGNTGVIIGVSTGSVAVLALGAWLIFRKRLI